MFFQNANDEASTSFYQKYCTDPPGFRKIAWASCHIILQSDKRKPNDKEMQPQPCRSPLCPLRVPHHQTWARCGSTCCAARPRAASPRLAGFSSGWMQVEGGQLTAKAGSPLHFVAQCLSGVSQISNSLAIVRVITVWTYSLWIKRASYKMSVSRFKYKRVTRCKQEHSCVPNNSLTLRQSRI